MPELSDESIEFIKHVMGEVIEISNNVGAGNSEEYKPWYRNRKAKAEQVLRELQEEA